MTIRALSENDIEQIKDIHARFYSQEFEFPDFFARFICAFAVEDKGKIIVAGGLRPIAESIILTDLEEEFQGRLQALNHVMSATEWIAHQSGFSQVHAFVQDKIWEKYLLKAGFNPCKGNALYINV